MDILMYIVLIGYIAALLYITLYCLLQLHLLYAYWSHKGDRACPSLPENRLDLPMVTVQLPIFNELYVTDRLIDNICALDYPRNRLEIQVLDDSTDITQEIAKKKVAEWQAKGVDIVYLHRVDRSGFKAGALKEGLKVAKGSLIAIFDADFLPRASFLMDTVPHFVDASIGVVQTRWEHINRDYSIITRLQALQLNVHFTIEQKGRLNHDYLLQFNGTAGIWRKATIEDAGGWEADTLTEDLDLSIRAQLKGWKIHFLEKVGAPAELPAEMHGLKSQQFRWNKGGAENARKMLPRIWRSSLRLSQKLHVTGQLLASGVFLFVFLAGVFSVPMIAAVMHFHLPMQKFSIFMLGLLSVIAVYYVANVQAEIDQTPYWKRLVKFVILFPVFLSLSMGLSLHNSIAVLQGYLGKKSPFVRTPKFNIQTKADAIQGSYRGTKIEWTTIMEGLLALYFLAAIGIAIWTGNYMFILFHILLAIGFGGIFIYTLRHLYIQKKA